MATSTIPPEDIVDDDTYASDEDSDFSPDNAPDQASAADSEDDDNGEDDGAQDTAAALKTVKQKKSAGAGNTAEAEDAGFENSGDEAIIGKGKKRRRKDKAGPENDGEDGDGAGGFVKTRSQRANEKAERRSAAVQGPVTVDVDALWKDMISGSGDSKLPEPQDRDLSSLATAAMEATADTGPGSGENGNGGTSGDRPPAATSSSNKSEMIKIKRTYNFAGQVHTEEKLVARDSAEAKLYLAETGEADDGAHGEEDEDDQPKRLPPRKAFRSAFEPVLDPALLHGGGRADLNLGLAARLQAREKEALRAQQAKKLTTVEKSRMDWAGFVDREGIQDELALAGKSKGAFVDRQQFLVRTEMRREEEAYRARMAKKV